MGNTKHLKTDRTNGEATGTAYWNDTSPTSSVVTLGNDTGVNTGTYVMYAWAEIDGYSRFGQYTGNGNTNGKFIYTGFKPALVIAKRTNSTANWVIFDNKRGGYNVDNDEMSPNTNGGDNDGNTYAYIDLLSNGFKWRETSDNKNGNNDSYIFMAFAAEPLVGDNPATAR